MGSFASKADAIRLLPLPTFTTERGTESVREACHDLRQPVAAILMLAAAAEAESDAPGKVRQRLDQIMEQARWLSDVLTHLLDGTEGWLSVIEPVDVHALLEQAVSSERLTYPGVIVLEESDPSPLYVLADSVSVRRVLANLLSNATKAAGPAGTVVLAARCQVGVALVEIEDDGPGFGSVEPGYGLGLKIIRIAVEAAGGKVIFGAGQLGGTRVRLLLPVAGPGHDGGSS
jgi:signal transduction histidine kinase